MRKIRYSTRTTKLVLAAVVASIVFAGVYGFAASLGLSSSGLGAGNAVVASCGTGIQAAYTTAYCASLPGCVPRLIALTVAPPGHPGQAAAPSQPPHSTTPPRACSGARR